MHRVHVSLSELHRQCRADFELNSGKDRCTSYMWSNDVFVP